MNPNGSALLHDRGIDTTLFEDILEAFKSLNRGVPLEVKCLVEVPVVEEQIAFFFTHVKRRSTLTLLTFELLSHRFEVSILAKRCQEYVLAAVRGHVHLDHEGDEAFIGWHIDLPMLVVIGHSIAQMSEIGEVKLQVVLCVDIARTSNNSLEILPLLELQRARLLFSKQWIAEHAEFELASAI